MCLSVINNASSNTIQLPAGNVHCAHQGRMLIIYGRVVAVGVSPTVFIVPQPLTVPVQGCPLLEQLVGFLSGGGGQVLRMRAMEERRKPIGPLEPQVLAWSIAYLKVGCEHQVLAVLPPRTGAGTALSLKYPAEAARNFWISVQQLAAALTVEFPGSVAEFRLRLREVAEKWEQKWNPAVAVAQRLTSFSPAEMELIRSADRAFASLANEQLERLNYRMNPAMVARLL
jgi:hypothetical protein